ncbi:YbcC family protein [Sulfoacidibacillus thermotolerans]|uniref:Probable inorganic carbon transporter subunit DabA n=1 Tax=Sulfoacidibacillus thermotolerans TaxID=1765684 RepID=A0A2U3D613_SULT2|nr:DUF2309 domain-containing protein [Sulfoacidibacillus thermotolerans]PWI56716.1 DUF2309 domain-containing protein [Sulfoacidibacillus thermotolerans]
MNAIEANETKLSEKVEIACQRIAPLWPIQNLVAVNPYFGLHDQTFWQAHKTLERITGVGLCMPHTYYREQIANGRITRVDLAEALKELRSSWDVSTFEQKLAEETPASVTPLPLFTDVLGEFEHLDWSNFVVERISQYCAAYFDEGQALWAMPWREKSLYEAWIQFAQIDKSTWTMGLRNINKVLSDLPDTAIDAIRWALHELAIPVAAVDEYLYAALLSIGGWAGWTRYLRWQAELRKERDDSIRDLLAIRLIWDALLHKMRDREKLHVQWLQAMARYTKPAISIQVGQQISAVLQTAFEINYQRQLATSLSTAKEVTKRQERTDVQAVFCIDVRSEVYRRAFETVASRVQTFGMAGFFGIPMEYVPLGSVKAKRHLPIFSTPIYRICEHLDHADPSESNKWIVQRQTQMRVFDAWKIFKTSASSCFSFVEAAGLWSILKLISDSIGWTRPVPHPDRKGLPEKIYRRLSPRLNSFDSAVKETGTCMTDQFTGIPEDLRPTEAESILRNMGLIRDFARIVLFVGHGSTSVNNPQATALDCGACAGQSGEASARLAVALLNDPKTRRGLLEKGILIPDDTFFVAGLHDTTTDEIQLFNTEVLPSSHADDLVQLRSWLDQASQFARLERASLFGMHDAPLTTITADFKRRTRDWAEVRPEWGLTGNAAFIVAPRSRTVNCNLAGRAFLHDYNWHDDTNFATLQLIMTAPMIVAHWINMQYYGSMVDNRRFGSGNKVLHNIVGGSIGVLEGNGGDLRGGLALQSLHDGKRWIHEPMRLHVFIEAPRTAIDDVIAHHLIVRNLIENAWLHLFQIDEDGSIFRRGTDKKWTRY